MDTSTLVGIVGALVLLYIAQRFIKVRSLKHYSVAEVDSMLKEKHDVVLLDVRTDSERNLGSIRGSIHIPLQALRERMKELEKSKGKEIVCFCQTGSRSVSAALLLKKNGFRVANMRGGMGEWNFAHR